MKKSILPRDKINLSTTLFEAEDPICCLQIIHGAKEHKERYYPFAEWLSERNIAVVISDHRGHGASVNPGYPLGHMDGWEELVADEYAVTCYIKALYPGVPLALLGHSFGSLLARCYLQKHDREIEKLVLSGTANYIPSVRKGLALGKVISLFDGKAGHNDLLMRLGDSDDDSWVCGDPEVMEAYRSDPLCSGYKYTNGAVLTIWSADREMHEYKHYPCRNPGLEVLSISGEDDPVTGGTEGLGDSLGSLRKIGYSNISNIVYPGMKHEVLNEAGNQAVYQDVCLFLTSQKTEREDKDNEQTISV